MAREAHDVVVIGAGHNGLIVAAYLLKAGLDVCVVEREDKVGGGVMTREVTLPGFKHDVGATMHLTIRANPLIHQDELGLISKYGLKYVEADPQTAIVFPDDRALIFYRDLDKTCESISQFSQKDAEAYRRYFEHSRKILRARTWPTFSPPPPFGRLISLLDESEDGRELLRVLLSSSADIADEWFENEYVRIAMIRFGCEGMIAPLEEATGINIFGYAPFFHTWGAAYPVGGSGALSEALEAFIRDNGGTIRLSSLVKSIKVEGDVAKAVVLDTDEEITATRAVVSNLNVKQLFLELLKPNELPPDFVEKVRRIKQSRYSGLHQAFALNEAPKWKAGGDVNKTWFVEIALFIMEDYLRSFDDYMYGIPNARMPLVSCSTLGDPSRAPEGKHTLFLFHVEPYNLKDGGPARWDEIKQAVADDILQTVRELTTNLGPQNILGRWIASPLDLERSNPACVAGDVMHIGSGLSQFLSNRPFPGWGEYRTPVKKLYMCGASTHPGPGVTGGSRAAVPVIMEDLGIDFKKVVAK